MAMVSDSMWPAPSGTDTDWTKPAAMALPEGGYFPDAVEQGRYGPIFPRTPANYGFSILAADSTVFSTLFGADESLKRFWKNLATASQDAVMRV